MTDFILAILSVGVVCSLYVAAFTIFTLLLESLNRK